MAFWHINSNSDWTLRKVTHGTLLFLFSQRQSLKAAAPPTSVYVKYFYRRRDEMTCWSATVSRMKLSQSFNRSPGKPSWQLQRRWSRWGSPVTLSFISSLAPPVCLSASRPLWPDWRFLLLVEVTQISPSKLTTGTLTCTFDWKVFFFTMFVKFVCLLKVK